MIRTERGQEETRWSTNLQGTALAMVKGARPWIRRSEHREALAIRQIGVDAPDGYTAMKMLD